MKMSLEDLKVDSYAAQVSENELTNVKGGTTPACVGAVVAYAGAAVVAGAAGYAVGTAALAIGSAIASIFD